MSRLPFSAKAVPSSCRADRQPCRATTGLHGAPCAQAGGTLFTVPSGLTRLVTDDLVERTAAYGLPPGHGVHAYRAAFPEATPGRVFAEIATDRFYRLPALRLAEAQARCGARAFVYEFTWPSPAFEGALGACHAVDVPFVFDKLADPSFAPLLGGTPPQPLADSMHAAWVSFATTGDPGWPEYREPRRTVHHFGASPAVIHDHGGISGLCGTACADGGCNGGPAAELRHPPPVHRPRRALAVRPVRSRSRMRSVLACS